MRTSLPEIWTAKAVGEKMGKTLVIITHDNRIAAMSKRRFSIVDGILTEEVLG